MTSLFLPFDTYYFFLCSSFLLISFLLLLNYFYNISIIKFTLSSSVTSLSSFFETLKPNMFNKISGNLFLSIFSLILLVNLMSVFSFNFPLSSQVSTIMFLAFGVWVSLIFLSIIKNLKGFLSHLIPEGTPLPLTFLLFMIELVSNIIRPLTLMVRLVANILAGHLLLILLSTLVFNFPFSFIFYLGLNLVEMLVAMIQSYIFTTMIVLYFSEV